MRAEHRGDECVAIAPGFGEGGGLGQHGRGKRWVVAPFTVTETSGVDVHDAAANKAAQPNLLQSAGQGGGVAIEINHGGGAETQ